jgi:hypothetical protein
MDSRCDIFRRHPANAVSTVISPIFVHAAGIAALGVSVTSSIRRCEHGLRRQGFLAGVLWACTYALQGASTGAALSVISAARTGTASLVHGKGGRIPVWACGLFAAIAVATAVLTWHGWTTVLPVFSSVLTTYALFFLSGRRLRWALLIAALLWIETVWSLDAPEPIIANALGICAAAMGIWRTRLVA